MTEAAKEVLSIMREVADGDTVSRGLDNTFSGRDDIEPILPATDELESAINYLIENEYVYKRDSYFVLSQKALHPYKVAIEKAREVFLESLCLPIAVSFITAVLTLWLKSR